MAAEETLAEDKAAPAPAPAPSKAGKGRGKTKQAILDTALRLFNARGVNAVTTNHIAAELNISPGNLYYHYRNKEDIVWHLFQRIESAAEPLLNVPEGIQIDAVRLASDITGVLQLMMDYRFLFTDIVGLIHRDERIERDYRILQQRTIDRITETLGRSYAAGPMLKELPKPYIEALSRNMWVLIVNWISYVQTSRKSINDPVTNDDLADGIFHVFTMMRPYMSDEAIADLEALLAVANR